jgi:ferredoxin-NADP reductase
MIEPWRTGKVVKIENANASTRRFWIQVPELERFDFKPGQFVTLDLPIHEKKNKRWRSYSIASSPDGSNIFELVIVLLEDGAGTNYLFNEVQVGTELLLRGPQGVFTLPDPLEKDLFLICTGTGIAPFRAMVNYIHDHDIPHKNIYLIYGCRKFSDTLYEEELKALTKKLTDFYYIPAYSREPPQEGITTGYVHAVYESIAGNNKPEAHFFLCGWKNMIDEAKQKITALGYDRKAIHLELYG